MNELHNKLIIDNKLVPKEGQRDLLCSNNESIRCPSFGTNESKEEMFSEEELGNISELCLVFKNIRSRLINEGYSINDLRKKLYEQETRREDI